MKEMDIRYKQRFENYERSFLLLKDALNLKNPTIFEKAGAIQFFETTFELSWKLLKDYLNYLGYQVKSPREAIKTAFQSSLLTKADIWIEALSDRNLTVHTYDEDGANEIFEAIKEKYIVVFEELYHDFKGKL